MFKRKLSDHELQLIEILLQAYIVYMFKKKVEVVPAWDQRLSQNVGGRGRGAAEY